MSKVEHKVREVSPEELEQFNIFMQLFAQQVENNTDFAKNVIRVLSLLLPKEDLMTYLDSMKLNNQLLENYHASTHGVTQEIFSDTVDKIQEMLSGETTTSHNNIKLLFLFIRIYLGVGVSN